MHAERRAGGDVPSTVLLPDSMNRITNLCRRWKERLGDQRLSGRTLRHSFVTGLLYSGAAPVEAKGLAGHRNLSTTDRYTYEISKRRAGVLENWQKHLADVPEAVEETSPLRQPEPPDRPDAPSDPLPTP